MSQLTTGSNLFKKATKKAAKLRLALIGPPGSGKTFSSLMFAMALAELLEEKKVALIDTEKGSASKYADMFNFDVLELEGSFHPLRYVEAVHAAESAGYGVLVIDSLSHAWIGEGGGLDLHDKAVQKQKTKNSYTAWSEVTPHHNKLVQALVQCKCHLICTMRSKVEYAQEKDERTGKTGIRKVGTAPLMRDGVEYEMDVVGDIDTDHTLVITKSRCPAVADKVFNKPGRDFIGEIIKWLGGEPPTVQEERREQSQPAPPANGHSKAITGAELAKRILDKDATLTKEGRCRAGELHNYVLNAGLAQGFGSSIADWPKAGFAIAVSATKEFEAKHPKAPEREPGDDPEE